MKADERLCPTCAETIKKAALLCRFCGHKFSQAEVAQIQAQDSKNAGLGCLAVVAIFALVSMCSSISNRPQSGPEARRASEAAEEAENRRKGFHCLSEWDGSHAELVRAFRQTLREPSSFEHIETRISPVNEAGAHVLTMEYRARNGFGGMNVGQVMATVQNSNCSYTIIATE